MQCFWGTQYFSSSQSDFVSEIGVLMQSLPASTYFAFVDQNVAAAYPELWRLQAEGVLLQSMVVSEETKHWRNLHCLVEACQERIDQRSLILAIGGGALLDLVGFLCSIMYRGLRYISIPTSLMGMADSAYGGKTAVNLYTKNQLGSYHFPEGVYVNPTFLKTLPEEHLRSGLVEVVKLAFFQQELMAALPISNDAGMWLDTVDWLPLIVSAATLKLRLFAQDPYEDQAAACFLYGHPFANAFETYSWQEDGRGLPHGCAVALGMLFSACLADRQSFAGSSQTDAHLRVLQHYLDIPALTARGTPTQPDDFEALLLRDKYCCNGVIRIPAFGLQQGYARIAMPEISAGYSEWRERMTAGQVFWKRPVLEGP